MYPKISENGGRPPIPLERMLRIYFLQLWFNLSDPAVEEALYDSVAMRRFVGIDLGIEGAPDETTVCKFRHLLERNKLGKMLLKAVNDHLRRSGIKIAKGTIVDATIIGAPSSTKNKDGKRDPEMHQTAKGKQWYFGMKAHRRRRQPDEADPHDSGVGGERRTIASALPYLLHGKETRVWGDQALSAVSTDAMRTARAAREGLHQSALSIPRPDQRVGSKRRTATSRGCAPKLST